LYKFPSFATVWLTKPLDPDNILNKLALKNQYKKLPFVNYTSSKLIHTNSIKINDFKYFDTLGWILRKSLIKNTQQIDEDFMLSDKVIQYMSVFSKVYIGYITKQILLKIIGNNYDFEIHQDTKEFVNDCVFTTIDKKDDDTFYIVFYAKEIYGRLKKIEILENKIKISTKDPKGFTVAETKFISHCLKPSHKIDYENITLMQKLVLSWR
jgi:hypothetical protein